jgi:eukaryotic-like serine/threonine-protein kinase
MNELAGYSLGGYQLEEEIGRGSMGVVYRGKQIALSREVAIKILPHTLAKDASYIARFIREAQIIAGLNHPNIVQIYDAGQQNRILYFVMEFVQGPTLASLLSMDGMIPQHLAAEYAAQIADALDAAYRERFVIHRDIKPENLMLNRWGKIKVMDFGLARATGHRTITIAKSLVGSIYYSSPEQIRGQILDNRSDIFALGIVLYEMVSGRRPFYGRTMPELSQAIISGKIQPPSTHNPELSPQLEGIILKSLSGNREQRYEEAALMAQELRGLNLQPPAPPIAASPSSLSLSDPLSPSQSEPVDKSPHLINQVSLEGTAEQIQKGPQPQQLLLPQQATFSQPSEESPIQDRQTVRDHIHRLFRLPSRKMPQSSTDTGKEPATGT